MSPESNEEGPVAKYVAATKCGTYAREARASLRALVEHVFESRGGPITTITYQELALRIGRLNKHGIGHAHGMGMVLGVMGHLLEDIDGDWGEGIPMIQCLVVVKNGPMSGLPDTGIEEFWPAYADMTRREKERCVRAEYQRVAEFGSRWDQVLGKLQLPPITDGAVPVHRGAGGESERHKRLKEFVRTHPEIVGATTEWDAIPEYPLPSLDEIDVLFRSGTDCIATEVKSAVSDALPADYERGIYQTIKYAALLKAMRVAGNPESRPNVRSVLILESKLPAQFRTTASVLGVTVIEDIKPL